MHMILRRTIAALFLILGLRLELAGSGLGGFGPPDGLRDRAQEPDPGRAQRGHPAACRRIRRSSAPIRSTPNMAGPAPIRTIRRTTARGAAQPGAFRQLSADHAHRHQRDRLRRRAALRDHRDRCRLRGAALADGERPRQGCGARLSRPLARRHPPAAAQLVRGRSGRQRGEFARPVHQQPAFDLGHLHPAEPRIWAAARRSTGSARWRRNGAAR